MRRLFLIAALTVIAQGCTVSGVPASPASVANSTVHDEQAGSAAELAYKAFRVGVTAFINAGEPGIVDAQKAVVAGRLRTLNNQAYSYLGTVRRGYSAVNAASYSEALSQVYAAIAEGYTYIRGN